MDAVDAMCEAGTAFDQSLVGRQPKVFTPIYLKPAPVR
jgi:hypothetical protein